MKTKQQSQFVFYAIQSVVLILATVEIIWFVVTKL